MCSYADPNAICDVRSIIDIFIFRLLCLSRLEYPLTAYPLTEMSSEASAPLAIPAPDTLHVHQKESARFFWCHSRIAYLCRVPHGRGQRKISHLCRASRLVKLLFDFRYGNRYISEECPEAVFILCLQSVVGVMIQCFMVGIVFAKLSRPKKRSQTLLFSRHAVICLRDGKLCLLFRVGDMRKSHIIGTNISAQIIKRKVSCFAK